MSVDLSGRTFADESGNTITVGDRLADGRYSVAATYGATRLSAETTKQLYPVRKEA